MSQTLNAIVQKLINGENDDPRQLSSDLVTMTAHLYNVGKEETDAEISYWKKWEALRPSYKTDKAADVASKATEEYQHWQNRRTANKMMVELIRSIKKRLAILIEEMSL